MDSTDNENKEIKEENNIEKLEIHLDSYLET